MNKLLLILLTATLMFSCNNGKVKTSSISGYSYKHFTSTSGHTPNVGDYVFFNMDIYDGRDSLLQTYRNQKILPSIEILDQTDENRKKNPMVDIISYLAIGDSAAIIVPIDSVSTMPPGLEYIENLEYHVVVDEILSNEEYLQQMDEEKKKQENAMNRLREMLPEVEQVAQNALKDYKAGNLSYEETPAGVKYVIHERGTGELPTNERMVTMQYYGMSVSNGVSFDNSFSRGRGFSFRLGRDAVIQGWHDATPYLPVGTKASLFIPAELGYGAQGSPPHIAPNEELYFYVIVDELAY